MYVPNCLLFQYVVMLFSVFHWKFLLVSRLFLYSDVFFFHWVWQFGERFHSDNCDGTDGGALGDLFSVYSQSSQAFVRACLFYRINIQ